MVLFIYFVRPPPLFPRPLHPHLPLGSTHPHHLLCDCPAGRGREKNAVQQVPCPPKQVFFYFVVVCHLHLHLGWLRRCKCGTPAMLAGV